LSNNKEDEENAKKKLIEKFPNLEKQITKIMETDYVKSGDITEEQVKEYEEKLKRDPYYFERRLRDDNWRLMKENEYLFDGLMKIRKYTEILISNMEFMKEAKAKKEKEKGGGH
jgi:hypothetical protein